jgi:hypothetical protein
MSAGKPEALILEIGFIGTYDRFFPATLSKVKSTFKPYAKYNCRAVPGIRNSRVLEDLLAVFAGTGLSNAVVTHSLMHAAKPYISAFGICIRINLINSC